MIINEKNKQKYNYNDFLSLCKFIIKSKTIPQFLLSRLNCNISD